jgi:hypothetical protein
MARFAYLRNTLTGNVFHTSMPGKYFGTSNRTADGAAIYERTNRAAFDAFHRSIKEGAK